MFTGIVSELGTVAATSETDAGRLLTISARGASRDLEVGGSVAVNGVCLTATKVDTGRFDVEVVTESLSRSNLGALRTGAIVDLERPTAAGGLLDGHIVQGHVDAVGTVLNIEGEGDSRRVRISLPDAIRCYVVEKGSVAVDGVSLTVTAVTPVDEPSGSFEVVLIPHTLQATVLGSRRTGDAVNLEADVLAKYVERLLERTKS